MKICSGIHSRKMDIVSQKQCIKNVYCDCVTYLPLLSFLGLGWALFLMVKGREDQLAELPAFSLSASCFAEKRNYYERENYYSLKITHLQITPRLRSALTQCVSWWMAVLFLLRLRKVSLQIWHLYPSIHDYTLSWMVDLNYIELQRMVGHWQLHSLLSLLASPSSLLDFHLSTSLDVYLKDK